MYNLAISANVYHVHRYFVELRIMHWFFIVSMLSCSYCIYVYNIYIFLAVQILIALFSHKFGKGAGTTPPLLLPPPPLLLPPPPSPVFVSFSPPTPLSYNESSMKELFCLSSYNLVHVYSKLEWKHLFLLLPIFSFVDFWCILCLMVVSLIGSFQCLNFFFNFFILIILSRSLQYCDCNVFLCVCCGV